MSAFGYFGSKHRIAAKLQDRLPPHNAWVELFCGSAAMTLAKKAAPIEVINDSVPSVARREFPAELSYPPSGIQFQ